MQHTSSTHCRLWHSIPSLHVLPSGLSAAIDPALPPPTLDPGEPPVPAAAGGVADPPLPLASGSAEPPVPPSPAPAVEPPVPPPGVAAARPASAALPARPATVELEPDAPPVFACGSDASDMEADSRLGSAFASGSFGRRQSWSDAQMNTDGQSALDSHAKMPVGGVGLQHVSSAHATIPGMQDDLKQNTRRALPASMRRAYTARCAGSQSGPRSASRGQSTQVLSDAAFVQSALGAGARVAGTLRRGTSRSSSSASSRPRAYASVSLPLLAAAYSSPSRVNGAATAVESGDPSAVPRILLRDS